MTTGHSVETWGTMARRAYAPSSYDPTRAAQISRAGILTLFCAGSSQISSSPQISANLCANLVVSAKSRRLCKSPYSSAQISSSPQISVDSSFCVDSSSPQISATHGHVAVQNGCLRVSPHDFRETSAKTARTNVQPLARKMS